MKIIDKKISDIKKNEKLNSIFLNSFNSDFKLTLNILSTNFFLDSHNYFPITEDFQTFSNFFSWGTSLKYENFYSKNFEEKFNENINNFKLLSNVFVLGSSSADNYYRNIITFLPRLFFNKENKIKLAIHRNSSNKFRNLIKFLCKKMNVEVQLIYLDDGFYKFLNSRMPQFLNKKESIEILNTIKAKNKIIKGNKFFISRQNCGARNLVNESDVTKKLKDYGYQSIDLNDMSILKQILMFSKADTIICPTGSGLTNIVFCNPGTKIIEISPIYNFDYENNFKFRFSQIANFLNLDYYRFFADPVNIIGSDKNVTKLILSKVAGESNYFKNLILNLEKIDEIGKI